MNLKEAEEYQRRNHKVPQDTIIASSEPFPLNQVFILSKNRFRIKKEITKDEFLQRHFKNLQSKDPAYGEFDLKTNSAIAEPTEENKAFPSPDQKYFYEVELIR